jgi:hypothetical protein
VAAVVCVAPAAVNILANLIWEDVEWQAIIRAMLVILALVLGMWAGVIGRLMAGLFSRWAMALHQVAVTRLRCRPQPRPTTRDDQHKATPTEESAAASNATSPRRVWRLLEHQPPQTTT